MLAAAALVMSVNGDARTIVRIGPVWSMLVTCVVSGTAAFVIFHLERRVSRFLITRNARRTPTDALPPSLRTALPGAEESIGGVAATARRPVLFGALTLWTAVGEEILYRGVVLLVCVPLGLDPWLALVLQASFYAGNHLAFGPSALIGKLLLGLVLGGATLLSGSVLPGMVVHVGYQVLVWRQFRWARTTGVIDRERARTSP